MRLPQSGGRHHSRGSFRLAATIRKRTIGDGGVMLPRAFHHLQSEPAGDRSGLTRRDLLAGTAALGLVAGAPGMARAAAPQSQLTWGIHVSLAPTWFDPADTQALVTPFM